MYSDSKNLCTHIYHDLKRQYNKINPEEQKLPFEKRNTAFISAFLFINLKNLPIAKYEYTSYVILEV
jgi:hypothetical protein